MIIKTVLYSFLFVIVTSLPVYGQLPAANKNHAFFIELGGPGFGISANFQQNLIKNSDRLSARIGLGFLGPIPGNESSSVLFTLPAGLQYSIGKNKKFEAGAGITPLYFTTTGFESPGYFISIAYYLAPSVRIMASPFFAKKSTLKYYFNINGSFLPFAGIDFLFGSKKRKGTTN